MRKEKIAVFDLSTEGLDTWKHRIIGITLKTNQEHKIITYRDEKRVLEEFWQFIDNHKFNKIIGFNSSNFDVPMLILRSIKHKVRISKGFMEKHIDLRQILFNHIETKKGTLEDFKEMLDIQFYESRYQKMHMSLLWETEFEFDKLKEFLLREVIVIWTLYEHLKETF